MVGALYDELRRLAQRERGRAGRPASWQTTALLHEAYLKLHRHERWRNQEHFLGVAVTAMRHVLIDAARARLTAKRGDGAVHVPLDDPALAPREDAADRELVRIGDALGALEAYDANLAKLVDCRFFAGLSFAEAAQILGVSERTAQRWWTLARAWIHSELNQQR